MRVFQIIANEVDDRFPLALVDDEQTVIAIGRADERRALADYGVEHGANAVEHYGEVVRSDARYSEDR